MYNVHGYCTWMSSEPKVHLVQLDILWYTVSGYSPKTNVYPPIPGIPPNPMCISIYTWIFPRTHFISINHYISPEFNVNPAIPGYLMNTIYIHLYLDISLTQYISTYTLMSPEPHVYPPISGYPLNPMYIHIYLDIPWTQCISISTYTWISPEKFG